jgi:hypothetical protein
MNQPEPWLRGPVEDVPDALQPVAHALLLAQEELMNVLPPLSSDEVWQRPGNIAPIGYHVLHFTGTIDRMLTYAAGRALSSEQFQALEFEKREHREMDGAILLTLAIKSIDRALAAVRETPEEKLNEKREVGRQKLPSNVRGLLFEIAVHTARHVGQIVTTSKLVLSGR